MGGGSAEASPKGLCLGVDARATHRPYRGGVRTKVSILVTALVLVVVPRAVFAVASTQRHMPLPVTAAMHYHYFEVGKRECAAAIRKAEAQAPAGQAVAAALAITTGRYPEEFRQDVAAGCQAASA
jgi:hypothetical protein